MAEAVTIRVDAWGDVVFAACTALAARPFLSSLTAEDDALMRAVLADALASWVPRGAQAVRLAEAARGYLDSYADDHDDVRFGLRGAVCGFARWRAGAAYDRVRTG